uniref:Uncharacterized protein n=1 Tax=Candidatus Berkiella aquae TaxID=295108 RepID=A0A0Q9YYZ6_9GAMM
MIRRNMDAMLLLAIVVSLGLVISSYWILSGGF